MPSRFLKTTTIHKLFNHEVTTGKSWSVCNRVIVPSKITVNNEEVTCVNCLNMMEKGA